MIILFIQSKEKLYIHFYDTKNLNDKFQIYSIFLDRGLHISPPGKSTLSNNDNYLKYVNDTDDNYENNEKNGIKKTLEICNSTSNGQILLFSIGNLEIKNIVKELNEKIPPNIVAIPYYGNLHPKYKEIIKDIDIKFNDIKSNKNKFLKNGVVTILKINNQIIILIELLLHLLLM